MNLLPLSKPLHLLCASILLVTLSLTGCKKNDNTPAGPTGSDAVTLSNATVESADNETFSTADAVASSGTSAVGASAGASSFYSSNTTTATKVHTPGSGDINDTTVTITYDGSRCRDGHKRSGTITVSYKGGYPGATAISIYSNNYLIDTNHIILHISVTYTPANASVHTSLSDSANFHIVSNDSITWNDGTKSSWSSDRYRYLIAGRSTRTPWDDIFEIAGTATAVAKDGTAYTATVSQDHPLYIVRTCPHIESGIITITQTGSHVTESLDYGAAGTCDDQATFKEGAFSTVITLPS